MEYRPVSILGHIDDYSMRAANAFAVVLDTAEPDAAKEVAQAVLGTTQG